MRLDQFLVARGDFETRAQAQAAIRAGCVSIDGEPETKPSRTAPEGARIEAEKPHPWVSRGGVKLAAALEAFNVDPAGLTCLDLGASTGGFTDVLLARGAQRVFAVDVGRDQLHPKLAGDPRVVRFDGLHAKELSAAHIPDLVDLLVIDVSFISLKIAAPPAMAFVKPGGVLIALIKPQFEVGRDGLGKGGIAAPDAASAAVADLKAWFDAAEGWRVARLIESPIAGGDGNREHLIHVVRD